MSAANKRRGSQFELDVLKALRAEGFDTERLRLSGTEDEGDLVLKAGGIPFIIEAKNEKAMNLAGYVREAEAEAGNYAKHRGLDHDPFFFALVKKRNAAILDAYVVLPLREMLRLIKEGI